MVLILRGDDGYLLFLRWTCATDGLIVRGRPQVKDEGSVCKLAFCYLRGVVARDGAHLGIRAIIPDWDYLRPQPTVPHLLSDQSLFDESYMALPDSDLQESSKPAILCENAQVAVTGMRQDMQRHSTTGYSAVQSPSGKTRSGCWGLAPDWCVTGGGCRGLRSGTPRRPRRPTVAGSLGLCRTLPRLPAQVWSTLHEMLGPQPKLAATRPGLEAQ